MRSQAHILTFLNCLPTLSLLSLSLSFLSFLSFISFSHFFLSSYPPASEAILSAYTPFFLSFTFCLSLSLSLSDVPFQMCINRQLSFALNNQTIAFNTLVITIRFVLKSSSFLRLSHNMVRVKNWFIEWPLDISKLKETHY